MYIFFLVVVVLSNVIMHTVLRDTMSLHWVIDIEEICLQLPTDKECGDMSSFSLLAMEEGRHCTHDANDDHSKIFNKWIFISRRNVVPSVNPMLHMIANSRAT